MKRAISFTPTSQAQLEDIEFYAEIKGFKKASDYALYAVVTMMAKNPLTAGQKKRIEELRAERRKSP